MVKTTMMNNSKITLSPISEKVNLFTTWWIGKHSKEYPEGKGEKRGGDSERDPQREEKEK